MVSCNTRHVQPASNYMADEDARDAYANTLAHKYIITDGLVDIPYRLRAINFIFEREFLKIPIVSTKDDVDYILKGNPELVSLFVSQYVGVDGDLIIDGADRLK